MTDRPSWTEHWFAHAEIESRRATCPRLHVGAVIVDRHQRMIGAGWNGAPSGLPHCSDVGCLIEPATGRCVTGSTVISKFQTGHYNTGHRTIRELWEMWQEPRRRTRVKAMKIRAVSGSGMIVPDRIVDVWKSGIKPVFRVRTSLGREVVTTGDHRFLTPDGWTSLESIDVGGVVALNGKPFIITDGEWLHEQYVVQGRKTAEIAETAGCSGNTVNEALHRFGIPIRPDNGGGWNRGLRPEDHPRFRGIYTNDTHARQLSRRHGLAETCDVCGTNDGLEVHHIDGDPRNINPDNWRTLCPACHRVAHTPHAKLECVKFDRVVSIEPAGEEEVFDLTTEHEHSFVGNGFALHNCKRTVHAEINALLSTSPEERRGGTMYVTAKPCEGCTMAILNSGLYAVYYRTDYPIAQQLRESVATIIGEGRVLFGHVPEEN